jgi:prepilin signal peptidase PulO-like enzyme (type II secretory pathway)
LLSSSQVAFIGPIVGSYFVLLGLLSGSFINLAADRLPRGESVIQPGSHCRACGRHLNAVDLLPVAGYVARGGRCATCRAPIGIGSPMVEAICGGLVLAPVIGLGLWPGAAVGLALVGICGLAMTGIAMRRRPTVSL